MAEPVKNKDREFIRHPATRKRERSRSCTASDVLADFIMRIDQVAERQQEFPVSNPDKSVNGEREPSEHLIFCRRILNSWRVEKRLLSDVKNGVDNIVHQVNIPDDLRWMQGFAADGDYLYWYSGDTNGENHAMLITQYSFETGAILHQVPLDYGESTIGVAEGNYKEPEGLFLYKSDSGVKSLMVGVTTGTYIDRNNKVFAYHSAENAAKFQGYKMQDIPKKTLSMQPTPITGPDGRWLIYVSASETIDSKVKNFKGYATMYVEAGVIDSPDPTSSHRMTVHQTDVGTGNIDSIDWQNRRWFVSTITSATLTRDSWQRVATTALVNRPWNDIALKNGTTIGWSYKPQVKREYDRIN